MDLIHSFHQILTCLHEPSEYQLLLLQNLPHNRWLCNSSDASITCCMPFDGCKNRHSKRNTRHKHSSITSKWIYSLLLLLSLLTARRLLKSADKIDGAILFFINQYLFFSFNSAYTSPDNFYIGSDGFSLFQHLFTVHPGSCMIASWNQHCPLKQIPMCQFFFQNHWHKMKLNQRMLHNAESHSAISSRMPCGMLSTFNLLLIVRFPSAPDSEADWSETISRLEVLRSPLSFQLEDDGFFYILLLSALVNTIGSPHFS